MKLDQIKKLLADSTPGPWACFLDDDSGYCPAVQAPKSAFSEPSLHIVVDENAGCDWPVIMSPSDAKLIAAAPEIISQLVAEVEAARVTIALTKRLKPFLNGLPGSADFLSALEEYEKAGFE